jgi:hypothetical protein
MGRNKYKRRVIERSRAKSKAAKLRTKATATAGGKLPKRTVAIEARKQRSLLDRLGQKKIMTLTALIGLLVGVCGLYFELFPRPSEFVAGKPISTEGGHDPKALFGNSAGARIHETEIVLFSALATIKYASTSWFGLPTGVLFLGKAGHRSYCSRSYVLRRAGAYRCVIQSGEVNTIADPCFGLSEISLICQAPDGLMGFVTPANLPDLKTYHPSLQEIGKEYPFHLQLDNGMTCAWNWLPVYGHDKGGWFCAIPPKTIEVQPARNRALLFGPSALNYNSELLADTNNVYYAEDLAQGAQNTWSILLEAGNNIGVFHRVSVAQAWY